jgi:hypothetical protein
VDVCAGGDAALSAGWVADFIVFLQDGAGFDFAFVADVQEEQHPAGLFVAVTVEIKDDYAVTGAHARPGAGATTHLSDLTQPVSMEPGAKSMAARAPLRSQAECGPPV